MKALKLVPLKRRRELIVLFALLASILYAWQVAGGWVYQDDVGRYESGKNIRELLAGRDPDSTHLLGTGIATGAKGTLYFYNRGVNGMLQVQDMPVLPATQVYQMWGINPDGKVDSSSIFRVPIDSQETAIMEVSLPRILSEYDRFLITIEPASGSATPSSEIVMRN